MPLANDNIEQNYHNAEVGAAWQLSFHSKYTRVIMLNEW